MKNLIQKIILTFSLLGFVTLTVCGQTENTQNQEVKVKDTNKNPHNLSAADAEYFKNLGITPKQVAIILENDDYGLTVVQMKTFTEEEVKDIWIVTKGLLDAKAETAALQKQLEESEQELAQTTALENKTREDLIKIAKKIIAQGGNLADIPTWKETAKLFKIEPWELEN